MTTALLNPISQAVWDLGTYKTTTPAGIITLVADVTNGAGESRYSALRLPGIATGYQVTAGKTLYITRIDIKALYSTWLIVSGTADAGQDQVAAPAGVKSEVSRTDGIMAPWQKDFIAGDPHLILTTVIKITSGRYPAFRSLTASFNTPVLCLAHEE
jgi:hypothetical protein